MQDGHGVNRQQRHGSSKEYRRNGAMVLDRHSTTHTARVGEKLQLRIAAIGGGRRTLVAAEQAGQVLLTAEAAAIGDLGDGQVSAQQIAGASEALFDDILVRCAGEDMSGELQGTPLFISVSVASVSGEPLRDAVVDIWHCDSEGFYDLQRPMGAEGLSARGRFRIREDGSFSLWTIRPTAYPIPTDGPVGEMLAAQGRHPFRPEHVHFLIEAPGHRTLITHLFAKGDDWLSSDVVFGVKESLIQSFDRHEGGVAPDGREMSGSWFTLHHDFRLAEITS